MFGKHFESMYTGSMVGAGAMAFAVMGYVIANMKPDRAIGAQVELNPKLMAAVFGESQEDIRGAIEWLCSPDPDSRSKEEDGRRLVKVGQFAYRVVNGEKYTAIRDEETRREYNRVKQAEVRSKRKKIDPAIRSGTQLPGEAANERFIESGGDPNKWDYLAGTATGNT